MSSILLCPVCGEALLKNDRVFACRSRHSFDIARQGYVNLLTGGGKGSHGDNAMMIEGRRTFLEAGYYAPLAEALAAAIKKHAPDTGVYLDIGCGEGYYTEYAVNALAARDFRTLAFDVSKDAVKAAAKRRLDATLFTASAYQMPIRTDAVDLITLFFSPFCKEEILRTLRKDGLLMMAIPGVDHLWELKQAVYDTPYRNTPADTAIPGLALLEEVHLRHKIRIEGRDMIHALFSMTPYFYKTSARDRAKLDALTELTTQTDFHLLIYRKE